MKRLLFIYDGWSPPEIFSAQPSREPLVLSILLAWIAAGILSVGLWAVVFFACYALVRSL